jgi:uncharacterized membrane protein
MSRTRIVVLAMAFLFLIQFVVTGTFFSRLPETIPTHWNFQGEPDAFGPRATIWIMPVMSVPLAALFLGLAWWIGKTDKERFGLAFMGAATLAFFVIMQVLVICNCLGYQLDMSRWVGAAIGLLFAAIGYPMKDLPRNHLAGIRLPWTLASDEAWQAAHRRGARIMTAGGLAGAVLCVLVSGVVGIGVSSGSMLYMVVDSYLAPRPARLAQGRTASK